MPTGANVRGESYLRKLRVGGIELMKRELVNRPARQMRGLTAQFLELAKGLEPPTTSLQMRCSTG